MPNFPAVLQGTHVPVQHPGHSLEHLPWPVAAFFLPGLDQAWSLKTPQQFSLALTPKYVIKTVWGLLVGCQEADTKAAA